MGLVLPPTPVSCLPGPLCREPHLISPSSYSIPSSFPPHHGYSQAVPLPTTTSTSALPDVCRVRCHSRCRSNVFPNHPTRVNGVAVTWFWSCSVCHWWKFWLCTPLHLSHKPCVFNCTILHRMVFFFQKHIFHIFIAELTVIMKKSPTFIKYPSTQQFCSSGNNNNRDVWKCLNSGGHTWRMEVSLLLPTLTLPPITFFAANHNVLGP